MELKAAHARRPLVTVATTPLRPSSRSPSDRHWLRAVPAVRSFARKGKDRKRRYGTTYWARPVPGFGDPQARTLILGLAPAAHGANRTGRVFTGDGVGASGDFLMAALKRAGFANIDTSQHVDDGLMLTDAYIAAAVRCAPPDNKPLPEEVDRCLAHLANEVTPADLIVVALGTIGGRWMKLLVRAPPCLGSAGLVMASCGATTALCCRRVPTRDEHQHVVLTPKM